MTVATFLLRSEPRGRDCHALHQNRHWAGQRPRACNKIQISIGGPIHSKEQEKHNDCFWCVQVADFGSARFATQEGYQHAEQHPPERAGSVQGSLETMMVSPGVLPEVCSDYTS